jgi:hypothetical protein
MEKLYSFFPFVNKFNILLIIPIFFLCYAIIVKAIAKLKKRIYESRNTSKQFLYNQTKKRFSQSDRSFKSNHFRNINITLRKQGNPLGLNAANYYLVKSSLFATCFALGLKNYDSVQAAFFLGLAGFFSINIYILFNGIIRNNAIIIDLLTVVDCLYLQMSAHVTLKDSLRGLNTVCKNPDLRKALVKLSAKYELTEYNIEEAADEFKESFNIVEIDMLSAAIKQQIKLGSSLDVLNNLSGILKDSYLNKLNLTTKIKILYITLGVVVILINLIALTFFPIFVGIGENMSQIFN